MKVDTTHCELCSEIVAPSDVAAVAVGGKGATHEPDIEVLVAEVCQACRSKIHQAVVSCICRRSWQRLAGQGVQLPKEWHVGGVDLLVPGVGQ
jgi:hypothetical protein